MGPRTVRHVTRALLALLSEAGIDSRRSVAVIRQALQDLNPALSVQKEPVKPALPLPPTPSADCQPAEFSSDQISWQMERILASECFRHSTKCSQFLRYVVEQTIRGMREHLKEYEIAVDVFAMGPSFDPRLDSLVRGNASRVRSKLLEYYRSESKTLK